MERGHDYLLTLNDHALIDPKPESMCKIFNWQGGNDFFAYIIGCTQSPYSPAMAHIQALEDNNYNSQNLANSSISYYSTQGHAETRQITAISDLDMQK